MKERIEAEDYISGLPHCIFDMIVVPYVKNLCENNRKEELTRIGNRSGNNPLFTELPWKRNIKGIELLAE